MAFDAEKFREAAKKAGISNAEIENEIKFQAGGAKPDSTFSKGEQGFSLGSIADLESRIGNDWWHLPVGLALGGAAAAYGMSRIMGEKQPPADLGPRIEPTMTTPPSAPAAPPVPEQRTVTPQESLARIQSARQPVAVQPPVGPANVPSVSPAAVQAPAAVAPVPGQVQPPVAVAPVEPVVPSVTEAVATGQNTNQAVKQEVAGMIDNNVSKRTRRTAAQIEKDLAESFAKAPQGMRPAAPAKTNKLPGDIIGQGGWHWYEGQMGPQAQEAWLREFGRTNQPYQRVVEAVKEGRLPVPAPVDGKKGGSFPRQEYVPEYIRGSSSLAGIANLGLNALGLAGLAQAFKEAKQTGDYSDVGLGALGQIVANIAPKAGIGLSLMAPSEVAPGTIYPIPKTKKEREELYEKTVGAGRGIAPPSMYQR